MRLETLPWRLRPTGQAKDGCVVNRKFFSASGLGSLIAAAAVFGVGLLPFGVAGAAHLDHFLCYTVVPPKRAPAFRPIPNLPLADQFGQGSYDVLSPEALCVPAEKNGEPIFEPDIHLMGYRIQPSKGQPKPRPHAHITVVNQFGSIVVDALAAGRLLVPSLKSLQSDPGPPDPDSHGVDHFACYAAKVSKGTPAFPKGLQRFVVDQFAQGKTYDITAPTGLCVPVDKNGEQIKKPANELLCYAIKPAKRQPKHKPVRGVHVNDQFGPEILDTSVDAELCVPPLNNPPNAVDDSAATTANLAVNIDVRANDTDLDGDPLTVTGATQGLHGAVGINGNGTLAYNPNVNFTGLDSFSYTINDGFGGTDTANVNVMVAPAPLVNRAPSVSAGPDQAITLPAATYPDGAASDDGLPTPASLTTTWTKVSGPGTVTFGNANAVDSSASFSQAGTYVLRLTADDGLLAASDDVTVTAGDPPRVSAEEDARASSVIVSPAGDAVTATATGGIIYSLTIPAGAVDADTAITVTPVTAIANLPFSGPLLAAVRLEPSGLKLARPATLTITLPGAVDPAGLLGFLFSEDGADFEVLQTAINGTTLAFAVEHFTTGGVAQADLLDFARQIEPLLNALPNTLPPTQVAALVSTLVAWIDRFGFAICAQTDLCHRVFEIGVQSLAAAEAQACAQAQAFVQQGEPFLAREALASVVAVAAKLVELGNLATQAGVPGFDQQFDVACVDGALHSIVDLASAEALANSRAGVLLLMLDVSGDAALLTLEDLRQYALGSLSGVVNALVTQAEQLCAADPVAGESLLDLILGNFPVNFLDALDPGLDGRVHDARAGCRIQIAPAQPTVTVEQSVQFSATTVGLSPSGVTWSIQSPALGSTIDPTAGLFTAGQITGTVVVVATSAAGPGRFKRATVTIVDGSCPAPLAARRGSGAVARQAPATCIQVTVSPGAVSVAPGATQQFASQVTGTQDVRVKWAVDGVNGGSSTVGTISSAGLYTAPLTAGPHLVRATSMADPNAFAEASVGVSNGVITLLFRPTVFIGACASANLRVDTAGFVNPSMTFAVQGDATLRSQTLIGATTFTTWVAGGSAAGQIEVTAKSVENPNLTASATWRVDPFVAAYGNAFEGASVVRGADANVPDDTYRIAVHSAFSAINETFSATLGPNGLSGTNPNGNSISVVIGISIFGNVEMLGTVQQGGVTKNIEFQRNCA